MGTLGREFKKPTDMRRRYHEDPLKSLSYSKLCRTARVITVVSHAGTVRVNVVTDSGVPRTVKL
jgi:hypothetical protein